MNTLLIGLTIAVVGYLLQQRSWHHKNLEDIRQREISKSIELVERLSRSIDKRLMAMLSFLGSINRDSVTDEDMHDYRQSVKDWMHEFSSNKTAVYQYFNKERADEFEIGVHGSIRNASEILLRTKQLGYDNLSKRDKKEHDNVEATISVARVKCIRFLRELNEEIRMENIGDTKLVNNVELGSLRHISRMYLIQRLLGLKS